MAVKENLAYVGLIEQGMRVLDVSDPANPVETGYLDQTYGIEAVAIAGHYCYTGDLRSLHVFNIANPSQAQKVASLPLEGQLKGIQVVDTLAYMTGYKFSILNVSNPASPKILGEYRYNNSFTELAVDVDYAYAIETEQRVASIDIKNPSHPILRKRYYLPAQHLCLSDGILFVSDSEDTLHIYRASPQGDLTELTPYAFSSAIYGVGAGGGYCYVTTSKNGVRILDVRNPENVTEVACDISGTYTTVLIEGQFCFLAKTLYNGIDIYNVYNPAAPILVGTSKDGHQFGDFALDGKMLYTAAHNRVAVYNCAPALLDVAPSTPSIPTQLQLDPAYPNPFNSSTVIPFALPRSGSARLTLFDLNGRQAAKLADGVLSSGRHEASLNAGALAAGVYIIRLEAGDGVRYGKVVLVR